MYKRNVCFLCFILFTSIFIFTLQLHNIFYVQKLVGKNKTPPLRSRGTNYISEKHNEITTLDSHFSKVITGISESENIEYSKIMQRHMLVYEKTIESFQNISSVKAVCDVGFGHGGSAVFFLTKIKDITYTAFEIGEKTKFQSKVVKLLINKFGKEKIHLIFGNLAMQIRNHNSSCDIIHVNSDLIRSDTLAVFKNLYYLASPENILLISACKSKLPLSKVVEYLKSCDVFGSFKQYTYSMGFEQEWCTGNFKPPINEFIFLNKAFCNPFFERKDGMCIKTELKPCSLTSDECFYNHETGVVSISCDRWHSAQKAENKIWVSNKHVNADRNKGHTISFNNYRELPSHLGHVIELGSGPFTQSQSILINRTADSITLVDPMAFRYIESVNHCFYKNGTFKNLPTTVCSMPVEELRTNITFDTVIMINVIEHVYEALPLLNTAVQLVKIGGYFILNERTWDTLKGLPNPKSVILDFFLHPIRIKSPILKQVISIFKEEYASTNATELKKYNHEGIYFIGKRRNLTIKSDLPRRRFCAKVSSNGGVVVLFSAPTNISRSLELIKTADKYHNIKTIILVLTGSFENHSLSKLIASEKVKTLVSYQHLHQWKTQVSVFCTPCNVIYSNFEDSMFSRFPTVCVGEATQ